MAIPYALETSSHSVNGVPKDVLETSAKVVDAQMQLDNSYPELTECIKMGGGNFLHYLCWREMNLMYCKMLIYFFKHVHFYLCNIFGFCMNFLHIC